MAQMFSLQFVSVVSYFLLNHGNPLFLWEITCAENRASIEVDQERGSGAR